MNAEEFQAAISAVDLTAEDAREQILSLNEGLMKSNQTLLTESKANKAAAQEAILSNEASVQAVIDAEKLRLEAANDYEGLKKLHASEVAKAVANEKSLTEKATNALIDRDRSLIESEILAKTDPRYTKFVKADLAGAISITHDENGAAIVNIKDGDASYSSATDFINGVKESDTWKHVLSATALSGANTQQSSGGNNHAGETVQSKLADRLKAQGLTQ